MKTIYIGIDVSKRKVDVCWLRDISTNKIKTKVFENSEAGAKAIWPWIESQTGQKSSSCVVVMEATGVYHERLAYALYAQGVSVKLTQPQQFSHFVKSFGVRHKTDKKDSVLLSRYGASGRGREWVPESPEVRHLKALLQRLESLQQDLRREENRLEAVVISGVSEVVEESIRQLIGVLSDEIKRLEDEIDNHFTQYPTLKKDQDLLKSIPGIGDVVSRYLVSVLRSRCFESASQCAAYLGVIPVMKQSGSSLQSQARLSKTGSSIIRAKLYMSAVVAIRYNPDAKQLYQRLLKKGKAKRSALGAVMRKLVHICFGVLKHQQEYCVQVK